MDNTEFVSQFENLLTAFCDNPTALADDLIEGDDLPKFFEGTPNDDNPFLSMQAWINAKKGILETDSFAHHELPAVILSAMLAATDAEPGEGLTSEAFECFVAMMTMTAAVEVMTHREMLDVVVSRIAQNGVDFVEALAYCHESILNSVMAVDMEQEDVPEEQGMYLNAVLQTAQIVMRYFRQIVTMIDASSEVPGVLAMHLEFDEYELVDADGSVEQQEDKEDWTLTEAEETTYTLKVTIQDEYTMTEAMTDEQKEAFVRIAKRNVDDALQQAYIEVMTEA
ncbi:MAG: hypothetical protein AB7U75_15010 [Hyphomicrobiaceae bacterium]